MRISDGRRAIAGAVVMTAVLLLSGSSCDPTTPPPQRSIDWSLTDLTDGSAATEYANGATAAVEGSHKYRLVLRSNDPAGVSQVAIWGDGNVRCDADGGGGTYWTAPSNLPIKLTRHEATINPGLYYGFVFVDPLRIWDLSCGRHTYSGPGKSLEYFALTGTLHVRGESTTHAGEKVQITLDLRF